MKNILKAGFCLVMLFMACKKTPPVYHDPIDSFLVQNFNYKPGTYWIYADSLTGEEDSFFVFSNQFYSQQSSSNSPSLTDHIKTIIYQNDYGRSKVAEWTFDMSFNKMSLLYVDSFSIDNNIFFSIPYHVGLLENNQADSGFINSINNNYVIGTNFYTEVVVMTHLHDFEKYLPNPFPAHYFNIFYFNSKNGIIKMNLNHGIHSNIWQIERQNIIK